MHSRTASTAAATEALVEQPADSALRCAPAPRGFARLAAIVAATAASTIAAWALSGSRGESAAEKQKEVTSQRDDSWTIQLPRAEETMPVSQQGLQNTLSALDRAEAKPYHDYKKYELVLDALSIFSHLPKEEQTLLRPAIEQRTKTYLTSLPEALWTLELNTARVQALSVFCEMTGTPRESLRPELSKHLSHKLGDLEFTASLPGSTWHRTVLRLMQNIREVAAAIGEPVETKLTQAWTRELESRPFDEELLAASKISEQSAKAALGRSLSPSGQQIAEHLIAFPALVADQGAGGVNFEFMRIVRATTALSDANEQRILGQLIRPVGEVMLKVFEAGKDSVFVERDLEALKAFLAAHPANQDSK